MDTHEVGAIDVLHQEHEQSLVGVFDAIEANGHARAIHPWIQELVKE